MLRTDRKPCNLTDKSSSGVSRKAIHIHTECPLFSGFRASYAVNNCFGPVVTRDISTERIFEKPRKETYNPLYVSLKEVTDWKSPTNTTVEVSSRSSSSRACSTVSLSWSSNFPVWNDSKPVLRSGIEYYTANDVIRALHCH